MASPTLIQVTNMSPFATAQQMRELFSYLGVIKDLKVYPEDDFRFDVPSKVCFIDFEVAETVGVALHLTNTIFIDRALIVARSRYPIIPDEVTAMSMAAPAVATASRTTQPVGHTAPLLPTPPSVLGAPPGLPGQVPVQPQPSAVQPLISLMGTVVPTPPPLTGNVDPTKIEEIRRTVYVGNLNSTLSAEQVLTFFQPCGEIKFVRMAGDETQPTRFAFVEFSNPESVPIALQYNGAMFGDRPIKVNHSKNAIVKPQGPTPQEEKREVDEAMRKVKEAMAAITNAIDPNLPPEINKAKTTATTITTTSGSHSKSPDRKRRRSRSISHSRSRRKRSYSRSPSPSYHRGGGYRFNAYSPPRRRHRSRSPGRRRSHRDSYYSKRSRSPRRRDRSRSRSPRKRDRSRSRSPRRRDRSRSRSPKRSRHATRRSRDKKSRSPERTSRRRGRGRSASRSASPSNEYGNGSSSASRRKSSKKSKKHRRRPSPTPSPSRSPSPAPRCKEGNEGSGEGGDGGGGGSEEDGSRSPGSLSGGGDDSTAMEEEGGAHHEEAETDSSYD